MTKSVDEIISAIRRSAKDTTWMGGVGSDAEEAKADLLKLVLGCLSRKELVLFRIGYTTHENETRVARALAFNKARDQTDQAIREVFNENSHKKTTS